MNLARFSSASRMNVSRRVRRSSGVARSLKGTRVAARDGPHQAVQGVQVPVAEPGVGTAVQVLAGMRKDEADRDEDGGEAGDRWGQPGAEPVEVVAGPAGEDGAEFGAVVEQVHRVAGAEEHQTAAQPDVESIVCIQFQISLDVIRQATVCASR